MILPKLYARTNKGAIQQWEIEFDGAKYRTIYGQVGGSIIITNWYDTYPTNVGRANARTAEEQAEFEANAIWGRKLESGYWERVEDIDNVRFIEPMLAKEWSARKSKVKYPVYVQPKLDGMRAIVHTPGSFSRNGKRWMTAGHIENALACVFEKYPDIIFDGELYCNKLNNDFDTLSSLVKKTKPTEEDIFAVSTTIQYWIYDIVDPTLTYAQRMEKLTSILAECLPNGVIDNIIVIVPTFVCKTEQEVTSRFELFVDQGYEGLMVRLNSVYEIGKRSSNLIKYKEFMESEYRIKKIGEGEGNKRGMAGYMILVRDDGVEFRSNIKGSHAFLRKLFAQKEQIEGVKYGTCKYFHLTPNGIPRFPYVIKIRDGIGVD